MRSNEEGRTVFRGRESNVVDFHYYTSTPSTAETTYYLLLPTVGR